MRKKQKELQNSNITFVENICQQLREVFEKDEKEEKRKREKEK